ncbi:MAG: hypothetical protein M3506_04070 [Chloroflexota bacterium]|nr:hypothetical protein [Chloroflexota bacterium]
MSQDKTEQDRERSQRTMLVRGQLFMALVWAALLWSGSDWTLSWRTAVATIVGTALFFTASLGVSLLLLKLSRSKRRNRQQW